MRLATNTSSSATVVLLLVDSDDMSNERLYYVWTSAGNNSERMCVCVQRGRLEVSYVHREMETSSEREMVVRRAFSMCGIPHYSASATEGMDVMEAVSSQIDKEVGGARLLMTCDWPKSRACCLSQTFTLNLARGEESEGALVCSEWLDPLHPVSCKAQMPTTVALPLEFPLHPAGFHHLPRSCEITSRRTRTPK